MAASTSATPNQLLHPALKPENDTHHHLLPITATTLKPATDGQTHLLLTPPPQDIYLSKSTHLTRKEVIRRRLHRLRQLSKCYRAHYWSLMEELRVRYREYCWKFGNSPFEKPRVKREEMVVESHVGIEGSGENDEGSGDHRVGEFGVGAVGCNGGDGNFKQCAFVGCNSKAMALTSFCHSHILSDANQKLYKACIHVLKR